jgi:hypothetical protein
VTEIRSFRRVFDLERRVYRVDRLRLNPGGVPVRGVVYFLVILSLAVVLARLPLVGSIAAAPPWYARDLAAPLVGAALLGVIRVEGRPFHLAALAFAGYLAGPRRLAGLRAYTSADKAWIPDDVVALPDGSDGRMRRLRYTGPGAVRVGVEHERRGRGRGHARPWAGRLTARPAVVLTERPGARPLHSAEVIWIARGARVLVRPAARRGTQI